MSLRILVFVGLRVYAIYFATQVVGMIPLLIQMMPVNSGSSASLSVIVEPLGVLLVAALLWVFAGRLAAAAVRGFDPSLDKFTLNLETAYTFAFVFLGLDFILGSIGPFLQQLYYVVAVVAQLPDTAPERSAALFQIYRPAITLIAGFACLLAAPFWARKLVAFGASP